MNTIRVSRNKLGQDQAKYFEMILVGFKISLDVHTAWYRIKNFSKISVKTVRT